MCKAALLQMSTFYVATFPSLSMYADNENRDLPSSKDSM